MHSGGGVGGGDGEAAMSDSSLAFRIAPILMSGSALVTVVHARNSATRLCNASEKGPQFRKGLSQVVFMVYKEGGYGIGGGERGCN